MARHQDIEGNCEPRPQGPALLPWQVVAVGRPTGPDERMMWAQSGLNRLMVRLGDLILDGRMLLAGRRRFVGGTKAAPRGAVD